MLTRRRPTNSAFRSIAELREAIDMWVPHWNDNPHPFVWHRSAEEIIDSVRRERAALNTAISKPGTHH